MNRTPEPELMDAPEQARAYAEADFSEPNRLFVEATAEQIAGLKKGTLIDLGCGPGDICIRLAERLPAWHIVGLDAGPNMLALAERAVRKAHLESRIELLHAHLPDELPDGHFEAIVSNSLLHHLPDPNSLWQSIRALGGPGCHILVMDLHRPDDESHARKLVDQYADGAPEILRQDFFNSLLAAWTSDEISDQLGQAGLSRLKLTRPSDRHWMVSGQLG